MEIKKKLKITKYDGKLFGYYDTYEDVKNRNITSKDNDYTIPNKITDEVDKMKFIFEKKKMN